MTIKDLKKELQFYDENMLILVDGYERGFDRVASIKENHNIFKDEKRKTYNGLYGDAMKEKDEEGRPLIKALILSKNE
jgi:hypothetical protein